MLSPLRRRLIAWLSPMILVPTLASAQTSVQSFEGLERSLKAGQTAIIVDNSGREIVGKVQDVSPGSLVILARGAAEQVFTPSEVKAIKRAGPVWDGAVKGAAGTLVSFLVIVQRCARCEGKAAVLGKMTLAGGVIGLIIDAAFGPKTVYMAPKQTQIVLAPVIGRHQQGLAATIRF